MHISFPIPYLRIQQTKRFMKTHVVLDLHYHPDEGQECFVGTQKECEDFADTQSPRFMYEVVPMTKEEYDWHNKTTD